MSPRGAAKGQPGAGGLPQVNLLPPEVRSARGLKVVRRWLAFGLVAVAVALGGVYALSLIERGTAEEERAEAQAETVSLQAEQERFAEVPVVLAALSEAALARRVGMSTEVTWKPYIDAITAVLPPNVSIDSILMSSATPIMLAAPPESPLFSPNVGQLSFTGRTVTVPDTAAWMDALDSIPGFSDAWVSASILSDEEGVLYYAVTATVRVTESAFAQRFPENETEED